MGDFIAVQKGDANYLYNKDGDPLSETAYDRRPFLSANPSLAFVQKGSYYGLISFDGEVDTGLIYDGFFSSPTGTKRDYILVSKGGKWGFLDFNLSPIIDFQYDSVTHFSDMGYAYAFKNGKAGIISLDGSTVVSFVFDWPFNGALELNGNMAVVWRNGKCGCIEITG